MRSHLSPLDGVFLELEQADDAAHIHIGWAMVFDPRPGGARPSLQRLREQVRQRLLGNSNLRRRLSSPRVGLLAQPVWLPDPDFDVGLLVRSETLPRPGGETELTDWLGTYFERRLDRALPLWEAVLLEGLEDGRWAIVCKVHHCLIDGISGACIMAALVDAATESDPETTALAQMVTSLGHEDDRGVLFRLRGAVGEELGGGIDATVHPRKVLSIVSQSRDTADRLAREELKPPPPTGLNSGGGGKRTVASLDVPLGDLRRIRDELGGEMGDVLLAMVAGGLQRLFEHRGQEVDQVRTMVSVNLRRASESMIFGNDAAPYFLDLPTGGGDPSARYRQIVAAAEEMRSGRVEGAEALIEAADLPPALVQSVHARLAFNPDLFDLTLTHVPAAPIPLYCLGARMRRVIPTIPLFSGRGLSIAATHYNGRLSLGLTADRSAIPDLDVLRLGITESLTDLARVAV